MTDLPFPTNPFAITAYDAIARYEHKCAVCAARILPGEWATRDTYGGNQPLWPDGGRDVWTHARHATSMTPAMRLRAAYLLAAARHARREANHAAWRESQRAWQEHVARGGD